MSNNQKNQKRALSWSALAYAQNSISDSLYVEHSQDSLITMLSSNDIRGIVSPIHDSDIFEDGEHKGEKKQAHFHLILMFNTLKSRAQVEQFCKRNFLKCGMPATGNLTPYVRYMAHLDDPDKAQYDVNDICSEGMNISTYLYRRDDSDETAIKTILFLINDCGGHIRSFPDLVNYCYTNNLTGCLEFIKRNCYFVRGLFI